MADRFEQARQVAAHYWQGIATAITSVVAVVALFYDPSKWPIAVLSALAVIVCLRFPRVAVRLTRWILGPPPAIENPPRVFRGPLPYVAGEDLPARKAEGDQCWLLLQQKPFFTLEGESGCGKSSFLAATLLPKAREIFTVVECRVEDDPLGRLAAALRGEPYRRSEKETTPEELRAAILAAGAPAKEVEREPPKPLLLCIDQFEELFVTARDEKRRGLMTVLRDAIEAGEVRVLLAIRSDFQDLLLGHCREADPSGAALDLGSYFPLTAFSAAQARAAVGEMLAPLHGGDPLKRQQLEDFADSLVEELLRPPRDRRLSREDEKTVLPVELQMVGFMLEAVGVEDFSADAFRRKGGKAGLLRDYIEHAKDFVWRQTGASGDQALLILRKLISPARTKWPQTAASIGDELGLGSAEVERILEAFAKRSLVKTLPPDEAGRTRYELMHEHLVQVLVEAPQPILQQARDAEERLRFWEERAAPVFVAAQEKSWTRWLAQPIPLVEALRLRRFASTRSSKEIIRRNFKAFAARLGLVVLPTALLLAGWSLWRQSVGQQMERIVEAGRVPADALVDSGRSSVAAVVADWAEALLLAGRPEEADSVWRKMRDDQTRSDAQARSILALVRSGRFEDALLNERKYLLGRELVWTDSWASTIAEQAGRAERGSSQEKMLALLGEISDPDIRALSLGIAAEAEGRAGRSREAAAVFEKAGAAVGSLDAEKRAEALLGLVERARGVRLFDTSLHLLRTAVVESQNAARAERPNILFSVALASARLGETDQAIRFLRDGLEYAELAWSEMDSWPDSILQATLEVGVRLAGSGRLSDVAAIARERNAKSLGSSEARDALVAALICVDHKNELAAISQSLDLPDRLEALVLASEYLSQHGRVAEARQLLFEVADLLSQTAPAQPHDLNRLAAQIGDLSLLARITQGMMPGRYPEGEIRPYDLQSLAQYGHLPAAIKAAWSIRERDDRLETLAALIVEAAQQEKIGRIQADIRRFLADLHSSSDRPPHLRLMDLAVALGEAGQVKAAREVVALVAADAQGRALSKLAVAFARSGHLDEARRLVDGLQDPGLKSETLASVVVEAARRGDSRALLFLPDVEYPSDASRARAAISIWKARDGELRRALEEADGCSSPADQLAAYTAIVVELAVKGDRISSRDALAAPDLSAMRRQLLIAPLARDS